MVFSVFLIPLILFAISIISAITFYLVLRLNIPACFGKVVRFTLAYIFINSFYSLVAEISFPLDAWKNKIGPFILMYGPILYFAVVALRDNKISRWAVVLHSMPFLVYLVYFIALRLELIASTSENLSSYSHQLYLLGPASFIVYTFSSFYVGRNLFLNQFRDKLLMFVFGRTLLLFLAMLFLITFSTSVVDNANAVLMLRALIYGCMLIFVLIVFNYVANKLQGRFASAKREQEPVAAPKYERSALTKSQLDKYHQKLTEAMATERLFLDSSLSLSSLANYLKIPAHHLTQVLSVMFKQTFYQYVNTYRINYACTFLVGQNEENLEALAEKCGFNSKVSFYRQFKHIKHCTPAEYRRKQLG